MTKPCGKEGCGMGGCCRDAGFKKEEAKRVAKDPVCGKKIDCDNKEAIKLPHGDKKFFFCSTKYMTDFINDPRKYDSKKRGLFGLFH